jgi:hypothetical protein
MGGELMYSVKIMMAGGTEIKFNHFDKNRISDINNSLSDAIHKDKSYGVNTGKISTEPHDAETWINPANILYWTWEEEE